MESLLLSDWVGRTENSLVVENSSVPALAQRIRFEMVCNVAKIDVQPKHKHRRIASFGSQELGRQF